HAQQVYDFLSARSLRVFLSEVSLREIGKADYQAAIDLGLEESSHLVLVASSRQNLESPWVTAEWRAFLYEVRSGRKTVNVITVLAGSLSINELPVSLRSLQVLPLTDKGLADLVHYLRT